MNIKTVNYIILLSLVALVFLSKKNKSLLREEVKMKDDFLVSITLYQKLSYLLYTVVFLVLGYFVFFINKDSSNFLKILLAFVFFQNSYFIFVNRKVLELKGDRLTIKDPFKKAIVLEKGDFTVEGNSDQSIIKLMVDDKPIFISNKNTYNHDNLLWFIKRNKIRIRKS